MRQPSLNSKAVKLTEFSLQYKRLKGGGNRFVRVGRNKNSMDVCRGNVFEPVGKLGTSCNDECIRPHKC